MNKVQHFSETIKRKKVTIEVWPHFGTYTRYSGYAFCPMKECKSKDALRAEYRWTVDKARKGAKEALSSHLEKDHGL